jgi:hypothetical protein
MHHHPPPDHPRDPGCIDLTIRRPGGKTLWFGYRTPYLRSVGWPRVGTQVTDNGTTHHRSRLLTRFFFLRVSTPLDKQSPLVSPHPDPKLEFHKQRIPQLEQSIADLRETGRDTTSHEEALHQHRLSVLAMEPKA